MGDRAHAVVVSNGKKVYLYTHWRGSDLPDIVWTSLKRIKDAGRLDDAPYLARMLFCDMVMGAERGETGFGISADPCEDTSRDVTIDVDAKTVQFPKKKPIPIHDLEAYARKAKRGGTV